MADIKYVKYLLQIRYYKIIFINMNKDIPSQKFISLANGDRVRLWDAATQLGILETYLHDSDDEEWNLVPLLRQVCLGHKIDPDQTRALIRQELLLPNGTVEPVLKSVVLSAVRGEGQLLHLESPFTNPLDKAMAEYINSREFIRNSLSETEAKEFFAYDPVQEAYEKLKKATDPTQSWADRQGKRKDPPDAPRTPPKS
ncbi:MAG: hypothetical protein ACRC8S_15025 [Fimbriiglobus sp.]